MSNTVVGAVYAAVIERVIEASKNDFEEAGADQQTLEDFKKTWQEKLSKYRVAKLPLEPEPTPPQVSNPTPVPSNVPKVEPEKTPVPAPIANEVQGGSYAQSDPRVKIEGGSSGGYAQMNGYTNATPAQQRAAALLHQQYGSQANASIAATLSQPGLSLPGQQRAVGLQLPGQGQQQQRPQNPQQYQQQQRSALGASQTDGSGDVADEWSAVMAERHSRSDADRVAADGMMRDQLAQVNYKLNSGLMVPLDEQPQLPSRPSTQCQATVSSSSSAPRVPQMDGADDDDEDQPDEEDDADAINSDLDDTDDEIGEEVNNQDGQPAEFILCTYDKTQRVKNKWKCTLKDGILKTNGREYLFHKAQGEFEW